MIVSSAIKGTPPYNTVLTHGFVVDGHGKKMSKSLGNVVAPQDVIKHHGAEILRLWTASADYSEDVRASVEIMNHLVDTYRKIRNTLRYILGNLSDFEPTSNVYHPELVSVSKPEIPNQQTVSQSIFCSQPFSSDTEANTIQHRGTEVSATSGSDCVSRHNIKIQNDKKIDLKFDLLDRYILSRLSTLIDEIISAYNEFKFYKVMNLVNTFFVKDLSNFYFDILKDKLYTYKKDAVERRASQYVLYELLTTLVPLIAPILSFTAEEVWQEAKNCGLVEEESVFLTQLKVRSEKLKLCRNEALEKEFEIIVELREAVNVDLEKLRKKGIIGSSLEAEVELNVYDGKYKEIVEKYKPMLNNIFIVSSTIVQYPMPNGQSANNEPQTTNYELTVRKFDGVKCPRCWVYFKSLEPSGICKKCDTAMR